MTAVRLAIFIATYILIAVEKLPGLRVNRPAASLLGAVAMVVIGGLTPREAYAAIDLDVIVFLLGMLLLAGYLELGGFFEWAASQLVQRIRSPRALLGALVVASGVLSALFINDTVCLMFTPVVVLALRPLGLRPQPYLLAVALGSNVGSAATLIGNPQNMLVGVSSGVTFGQFTAAMTPVSLLGLGVVYMALLIAYRSELDTLLAAPAAAPPPMDTRLVVTTLTVFAGALAGWLAGLSLPLVSITAGAAAIALSRRDASDAFAKVEWSLLLFFAGLFVVMRGVRDLPLFVELTSRAANLLDGNRPHDAVVVSTAMLVLSNLVSNVPAVLLWLPVVPHLPHGQFVWIVMAMSATMAGNFTLVGSMANLIVAERASARGVDVGFWEYVRVGAPVTIATIAIGIVLLVLSV